MYGPKGAHIVDVAFNSSILLYHYELIVIALVEIVFHLIIY